MLFITEDTDMDVTKKLLVSSIKKTKAELGTTDKDQWMVLPHNEFDVFLEENVTDIQNRLKDYKRAYGQNPEYNPVFWFWVFGAPVTIITLFMLEWKINGKRETGYYVNDISIKDIDFWHRW